MEKIIGTIFRLVAFQQFPPFVLILCSWGLLEKICFMFHHSSSLSVLIDPSVVWSFSFHDVILRFFVARIFKKKKDK
jgi:hypothetical protein